jgi:hypothetical protein
MQVTVLINIKSMKREDAALFKNAVELLLREQCRLLHSLNVVVFVAVTFLLCGIQHVYSGGVYTTSSWKPCCQPVTEAAINDVIAWIQAGDFWGDSTKSALPDLIDAMLPVLADDGCNAVHLVSSLTNKISGLLPPLFLLIF